MLNCLGMNEQHPINQELHGPQGSQDKCACTSGIQEASLSSNVNLQHRLIHISAAAPLGQPKVYALPQVLEDARSRAEYDQHLAAELQAAGDIPIAEEVQLSDLKRMANLHEHELACRCGGSYVVSDLDLQSTPGSMILPCSNCSLHVLLQHE